MSKAKESFPWVRDVVLIAVSIVMDRTVTYRFPTLLPVLPYAWLLIALWLTREIITKTRLHNVFLRAYSRNKGKRRMVAYIIVFVLGGILLCFYWYVINRVLDQSPVALTKEQVATTASPAS